MKNGLTDSQDFFINWKHNLNFREKLNSYEEGLCIKFILLHYTRKRNKYEIVLSNAIGFYSGFTFIKITFQTNKKYF